METKNSAVEKIQLRELRRPIEIDKDMENLRKLSPDDITCCAADFALAILAVQEGQKWKHTDAKGNKLRASKNDFDNFIRKQHYGDEGLQARLKGGKSEKKVKKNADKIRAIQESKELNIRILMRFYELISEAIGESKIKPKKIATTLRHLDCGSIALVVKTKIKDALKILGKKKR
jgi:hypothetical protein